MNKIKAIIFDLDDTLMDRKSAMKAFSEVFADRYFPCVSTTIRNQMIADMITNDSNGYTKREEFFKILIALWNWIDAPEIGLLVEMWRIEFPNHAVPAENMDFVLNELKAKGYKLGLITNGRSLSQNKKINVLGLRPKLDNIIISEEVMMTKPDPEIFKLACRNLGIITEKAVFVGDNLRNDVYGSINAGMSAIWVNNADEYDVIEEDVNCARIQHLIELLGIV